MVSTFAKDPVWMLLDDDNSAVDVLINNVYRQVLGNAYVMESERLVVPESQIRSREISVREFVRLVAKSELYRSKFFDSCYRYRAIELNFKHLLGRAPADFDEMRAHSNILDYGGHDAEIDSYIESDEYQDAYGEMVVPFERGFSTQMGLSMQAVTNMRFLQRGAASSDKDLRTGNRPKLQQVLIYNYVGPTQFTDVNALMANLFKRSDVAVPVYVPQVVPSVATPQSELRDSTQAQIDALRPMANIGAAIVSNGSSASTGNDSPSAQLAEARALASVAEYRLNKWRSRSY
jgi:phycoerythrin-associated linker protein